LTDALPIYSGVSSEGASENELRYLPAEVDRQASSPTSRRNERRLTDEAAAEDQPRSRDVVAGGDHHDSPPAAFAGEASDSPSFTARRRRFGDDGQDLERKTPCSQELRDRKSVV